MASQLSKLRSKMADSGVDAMLVSAIDNVRWLTGFSGSSGYAIVTSDKAIFITDSRYDEAAREQVRDLERSAAGRRNADRRMQVPPPSRAADWVSRSLRRVEDTRK